MDSVGYMFFYETITQATLTRMFTRWNYGYILTNIEITFGNYSGIILPMMEKERSRKRRNWNS